MFTLIIATTIVAAFVALCIAYRVHGAGDASAHYLHARLLAYGTRRTRTQQRMRTYGTRTHPTHWQ